MSRFLLPIIYIALLSFCLCQYLIQVLIVRYNIVHDFYAEEHIFNILRYNTFYLYIIKLYYIFALRGQILFHFI